MHQSSSTKRRVVHNAYVDIDDVSDPPGPNCNNWIQITKRKLRERESKLLKMTQEKIESIVNETLNTITNNTASSNGCAPYPQFQSFIISDSIIASTFLVLTNDINKWNGVQLSRLKKPLSSYRDYYNVGKKNWDRRKTKIFGSSLWVNVFKQIHQFVWMHRSLFVQTLHALFCATIKYNHTRAQSLISGTIICESREFQEYLCSFDDTFRIQDWIIEQKTLKNKHVAKALHEKMRSHLNVILHQNQQIDRNNVETRSVASQLQPVPVPPNFILDPFVMKETDDYIRNRSYHVQIPPLPLPMNMMTQQNYIPDPSFIDYCRCCCHCNCNNNNNNQFSGNYSSISPPSISPPHATAYADGNPFGNYVPQILSNSAYESNPSMNNNAAYESNQSVNNNCAYPSSSSTDHTASLNANINIHTQTPSYGLNVNTLSQLIPPNNDIDMFDVVTSDMTSYSFAPFPTFDT